MRGTLCNRVAAAMVLAAAAALVASCSSPAPVRKVSLFELETAPTLRSLATTRTVIRDLAALRRYYTPLTDNAGLLQIRTAADWRRAHAQLGWNAPPPDFDRGSLVGLVCTAGTPLNGAWPVGIDSIKLRDAGGLISASIETGVYLADSVALAEWVFVPDLDAVLVVDLGAARYYAE